MTIHNNTLANTIADSYEDKAQTEIFDSLYPTYTMFDDIEDIVDKSETDLALKVFEEDFRAEQDLLARKVAREEAEQAWLTASDGLPALLDEEGRNWDSSTQA